MEQAERSRTTDRRERASEAADEREAAGDAPTVVYGLGDPSRGDAGVGWLVVDLLDEGPQLTLRRSTGDLAAIAAELGSATPLRLVVVVAVRTGAPPGTLHRWDPVDLLLALLLQGHAGGELAVGVTARLGEALERSPHQVSVVGIEGSCFARHTPPSPAVLLAAEEVAAALQRAPAEGVLAVPG